MPPLSRKRNKGKDRKAKKEEAIREQNKAERLEAYHKWYSWAIGAKDTILVVAGLPQIVELAQCNHGLITFLPDESHPVSRFISDFFINVGVDLKDMLQKHQEVQNDDTLRKMAASILTLIGSNWLREGRRVGANIPQAIMILEHYGNTNDYDSTIFCRDIEQKNWDLRKGQKISAPVANSCGNRDLLKFFRKRIACKCLKKMHLEARKTQPKLGACCHCNLVRDRSKLMVCSRCMIAQYCSRGCQKAAYNWHWRDCNTYVWAHEVQAHCSLMSNSK